MRRRFPSPLLLAMLVLTSALGATGCRDRAAQRAAATHERAWAPIAAEKRALDGERKSVRALRARLLTLAVDADGTPAAGEPRTVEADVVARERALAARSAALEERLVRWIATAELHAGEPEPAPLRAAIHLKSDEDVAVAQEWIERGGDYDRAIAILDRQQHADPGYAPLERALQQARATRLVTPQRFALVQPGMTRADVRTALGPVNLRNVVQRPQERVEAWFYPRSGGGTAGVYFRYDAGRRAYLVYQADLQAGRPSGAGAPPGVAPHPATGA